MTKEQYRRWVKLSTGRMDDMDEYTELSAKVGTSIALSTCITITPCGEHDFTSYNRTRTDNE